jgi:hypothetical protein
MLGVLLFESKLELRDKVHHLTVYKCKSKKITVCFHCLFDNKEVDVYLDKNGNWEMAF